MAKFLANENVPQYSIEVARRAGHDIAWVKDILPGGADVAVLAEPIAWEGCLSTAQEGRLRVVPLSE